MTATFGVGDGSHGPFGCFIVAELVITPGPWEFDAVQFDVAARGGHLGECCAT